MGKYTGLWNRKYDGDRKESRQFLRVAVIATTAVFLFLLLKKDNLIRWAQAGLTIEKQNREILENQKVIDRMEQRLYNLEHNRDSLEKFARERFNFTKEGENLYIVVSEK